jgi:GTP cyclohydrolase I
LPDPRRKGIHMSRLYLLLDDYGREQRLTPRSLAQLMSVLLASHADCQASHAMLELRFELLLRRPALVSAALGGWKAYPVRLRARGDARGGLSLDMQVGVAYSSTCPCSAALARQALSEAFLAEFGGGGRLDPQAVSDWLLARGSMATPHSQRSLALVTVALDAQGEELGVTALVDAAEQALGTPVQTAVKRADEQAFARLNGEHLMYVEDAARRLHAALSPCFVLREVQVRHRESLHAHDAVARIGPALCWASTSAWGAGQ